MDDIQRGNKHRSRSWKPRFQPAVLLNSYMLSSEWCGKVTWEFLWFYHSSKYESYPGSL